MDAKMQEEMAEKRRERAIKEMEKAKNIATSRTESAKCRITSEASFRGCQREEEGEDELFRETRALEKKCLELA